MVNVDEDMAGEVGVPAAERSAAGDGPAAEPTSAAGRRKAGDGPAAPARRRRAADRPFGMSMSMWRSITAATRHVEQVQRLERMVESPILSAVRQSVFTAQPVVRQLIQSPPVAQFIAPAAYWPPTAFRALTAWTPVADLLRATPAWPACSGVLLMTDSTRHFLNSITETLTWQLDVWSDQRSLEGRVLLAEAHQVREHLLSESAGDLGPVEEFAFEWLGYIRPARAEQRAGLLDAVIDVLLGASWQVTPARARALLRRKIDVTRRGTRPFWEREINGRSVISCDLLVPSRPEPDGVTLISLLPGGHDVERDALDRVAGADVDPAVRWLTSELTAEEMAVVWCHVDGGVTWQQAALLCEQDERMGESVRRKVKRLVCRRRGMLRAPAR